ncbi:hypothetical protein QJS66_09840 [Kocuria rhizophila]|nr:hypothetical protein QJS66_09840 [Kocuria rhizophila]
MRTVPRRCPALPVRARGHPAGRRHGAVCDPHAPPAPPNRWRAPVPHGADRRREQRHTRGWSTHGTVSPPARRP